MDRPRRRGLIPRMPDRRPAARRLESVARARDYRRLRARSTARIDAGRGRGPADGVSLHPAARRVVLHGVRRRPRRRSPPRRRPVGPGYHRFVGRDRSDRTGRPEVGVDADPPGRADAIGRDLRRSDGRRARLPRLARARRSSQARDARAGAARREPARRAGRHALHLRGRDRDAARAASTTPGSSRADRRPATSPSTITPVVGRRDRRAVRCSTGRSALMWIDVRWRPPAVERRGARARGRPSAALEGLSARAGPAAIRGTPGPRSSALRRLEDAMAPPGHRPVDARARAPAAGHRLPARRRSDHPRGLERCRSPGVVRRAPDGRGMVGRRRGPGDHACRGQTGTDRAR